MGRKQAEDMEKAILDSFCSTPEAIEEEMTRSTHSYAIVEVSQEAYNEIRNILGKAGYQHAFHDKKTNGEYDEVIDMQGLAIAVVKETTNA